MVQPPVDRGHLDPSTGVREFMYVIRQCSAQAQVGKAGEALGHIFLDSTFNLLQLF